MQLREIVFGFSLSFFSPGVCTEPRHVALRVTPAIDDYDSTNFLKHCFVVSLFFFARVFVFKPIHHWIVPILVLLCCSALEVTLGLSMEALLVLVEDSFKKAFVQEWVFISDVPSEGPNTYDVLMLHNTDHSEYILMTPRTSKHSTSLSWETAKPQDKACFWERIEAPLPPLRPRPECDFIHVNSVPFLSVWYCR